MPIERLERREASTAAYYLTPAATHDGSHAHRMATRASATDHALNNTWALGLVLVLLFGR